MHPWRACLRRAVASRTHHHAGRVPRAALQPRRKAGLRVVCHTREGLRGRHQDLHHRAVSVRRHGHWHSDIHRRLRGDRGRLYPAWRAAGAGRHRLPAVPHESTCDRASAAACAVASGGPARGAHEHTARVMARTQWAIQLGLPHQLRSDRVHQLQRQLGVRSKVLLRPG